MILLIKQFLPSRAFMNPKGSVRWPHSQSYSYSSSHDCNPYRRIQRCAGAGVSTGVNVGVGGKKSNSAPLHAVESRELRFYGMSPVLLENDSCENGESQSLETPTPNGTTGTTGVSLNMSSLMNNLSLSGTTTMNLSSSNNDGDDHDTKDPIFNLLSVMNNGNVNHNHHHKRFP